MNDDRYDVVVVGGGAAGLASATALARARRSVLVVDAGEPRNAPAAGAHNVLGHDGIPPLELLAAGRREALGYGADIRSDRVEAARRTDDGFTLTLVNTGTVTARRIVLATGLADELPDIPGVREHWGRTVLHCPYCHGWEVRDRRIGVLATSAMSLHQVQLFRQLSADVTFFTHTLGALGAEERRPLLARGIRIIDGVVEELRTGDGSHTVVLAGGRALDVDAVVVAPRFHARAELYVQLGGTITEHPLGSVITVDPTGKTDIPGVWAAGNVGDLSAMVSVASGAGVMAGAAVNADLVAEEVAAAVEATAAGRV